MTIAFFGTGGTIANRGTTPDDYLDYLDVGEVMEAEELLASQAEFQPVTNIRVEPFGVLRSKYITSAHWVQLAQRITTVLADSDSRGAVVAHGTGTLEETAWFLHLTLNTTKPVVVVGAQRPGITLGSDVALNLADAFRVAAAPTSNGAGVTVVMNRQIHSARDVLKVANHRLDALQSPVRGPLGVLHADHTVEYFRTPTQPHTAASMFATGCTALPRVDVVHAYTDADATALEAFRAAGATGIIAVGYPPGTLPKPLDDAVDRAIADGIVVVQATRAVLEPAVVARPGLIDRGLIPNGDLTPEKARILLQLCLAHELDHAAIRHAFETY